MPVLGICRGAQVVNVAMGGTLHQHLPDVLGHTRHQQGNAVFTTSSVRTVPGTRLAALIGESSDAQCYHHQAIDRLGEGLIVSAQDADGVIEAVEIDPATARTSGFWRCSGTPRNGWTTCGCSPLWSKRARRICERKSERVTASDVINPATEELLRTVEQTDLAGVDDAVARAKAAQRDWARRAPAERAAALRDFAATVDAHVDELAALEVANSGHPIGNAQWEAGHVRDVLQFYSASPERLSGKQIPVAGGLDVTFNEPLGVVGVITPWNFPMTDRLVGVRAGTGRRQCGAGEAGGMDAADHDPAG